MLATCFCAFCGIGSASANFWLHCCWISCVTACSAAAACSSLETWCFFYSLDTKPRDFSSDWGTWWWPKTSSWQRILLWQFWVARRSRHVSYRAKGYVGLSVVHLRGTPSSNEMCRGRKQAAPHTQSVSVSNSDPVLDSRAFLDSEVLGRGASRG